MNKLLAVALLAQGATAFAPAKQPLTLATTAQRDGKWCPLNEPLYHEIDGWQNQDDEHSLLFELWVLI